MNENGRPPESPDLRYFDKNRAKYPPEQLVAYEGQFVAWSPDGLRILASAADRAALYKKLDEAGIHFSQVVFDYVYPGDTVLIPLL